MSIFVYVLIGIVVLLVVGLGLVMYFYFRPSSVMNAKDQKILPSLNGPARKQVKWVIQDKDGRALERSVPSPVLVSVSTDEPKQIFTITFLDKDEKEFTIQTNLGAYLAADYDSDLVVQTAGIQPAQIWQKVVDENLGDGLKNKKYDLFIAHADSESGLALVDEPAFEWNLILV
jgi:hypothetical protein